MRMPSLVFLLDEQGRAAPLSRLRLGNVGQRLEAAGFCTLGDVLARLEDHGRRSRILLGLTRAEAADLQQRLSELVRYLNKDGSIRWDRYHDTYPSRPDEMSPQAPPADGIPWDEESEGAGPQVPSLEISDGAAFLAAFPEVIDAIVRSRDKEVDRILLLERLTRQPKGRKTLDQIAKALPFSITRQRVQQRETKLLTLLANALLHGRQRRLGVRFRPSFTDYWRVAANQFRNEQEISFGRFLAGLEAAWSVDAAQILEYLPFITSVLTSKATIPESFRAQMMWDPRLYLPVAEADRALPVTMLALGRGRDEVAAAGIESVGDFLDVARQGDRLQLDVHAKQGPGRALAGLLEAIGSDGHVDWAKYARALELTQLPERDPTCAEEFLQRLPSDLEAIVRVNQYSIRAGKILSLRILPATELRPTLHETADQLDTHGSTIKREESVLLGMLNDQLVDRDLTRSDVLLSPAYLAWWGQFEALYRGSGGDYEAFCMAVSHRWAVRLEQLTDALHIVWAVLDRYPQGRLRTRKVSAKAPMSGHASPPQPSGTVVLRGFRRVH